MMLQKKREKVSLSTSCLPFLIVTSCLSPATGSCSSAAPVCAVLREQEKNWPCYECNRRFVSSEQLQQHLNMHDDKLNSVTR